MRLFKNVLGLALVLGLVTNAFAAEEKADKAKGKGKRAQAQPVVRLPKEVTLTEEQQAKVNAVNKEYAAKAAELQKNVDSVLTDEQKKARQEAQKAARESGKKGRDAQKSINEALKLTDEQKKKYEDATKALADLRLEALKKVAESLTPEQKEKIPQLTARKGKKADAKKPDAKKPEAKKEAA